jgi:hypothetical protein
MVIAIPEGWKDMILIQMRIVRNSFTFKRSLRQGAPDDSALAGGLRQRLQRLALWLVLPAVLLAGCSSTPVAKLPSVAIEKIDPPVRKPLKIGLALGGGAARGFAHVGVIAVLEEAGFKPQLVVGTSAGSLVAAIYASGKTSAQLQQTALTMEEVAITDWMLPIFGRGMFRGDALARYVNQLVGARLIENMAIPLGIVATDLNSGQAVLFQRGSACIECGAGGVRARQDQWPRVCRWRSGVAGAGALRPANGRRRGDCRRYLQSARRKPGGRHAANLAADLCHHG